MAFFFFMSGFLFYLGADTISAVAKKLRRRINTLLIPFLLWQVIVFVLYKILRPENYPSERNILDVFFFAPLAGPLWYCAALLILLLPALIFVLVKNRHVRATLMGVVALWFVLRSFGLVPAVFSFERWWWYENMLWYAPVFLAGAIIAVECPALLLRENYANGLTAALGLVMIMGTELAWTRWEYTRYYLLYAVIELVGVWLLVRSKHFTRKPPAFYSAGFYIFALHNPILVPMFNDYTRSILKDVPLDGFTLLLLKLLAIVVIVLISILAKYICERIFSRPISAALTGGR